MIERYLYKTILVTAFPLALVTFAILFFIRAPYGRYQRRGWGPTFSNRWGWLLMEAPSVIVFSFCYLTGNAPKTLPIILFFFLWQAHYLHRAFIYPFMISDGRKVMPLTIVLMAFVFNAGNAYINGRFLFSFSGRYPTSWLASPQMITGLVLFTSGFTINRWADRVLHKLRAPGETGYKVPHGGLYRWISCPNYFGEIVEWVGWAVATWSLPGLAFALWTFANLAPRAQAHHAWYHGNFPNYPEDRKALVPGIW